MTDVADTFKAFASTLSQDQMFKLQPLLKPTQLQAVLSIVLTLKSGKPADTVAISALLNSISGAQLKSFGKVLTQAQLETFAAEVAKAKAS